LFLYLSTKGLFININIFYNPKYIKTKKVFITKQLKHSKLVNLIINFCYLFNMTISENLIQSGPHKRMNNLLKTFKGDDQISFNKIKYNNNYVVQYDQFGKSVVEKIIKSKTKNKKIFIGPLYNIQQDFEINQLITQYPYIKKIVASDIAKLNTHEMDNNFDIKNALICPSGVISQKEVLKNLKISNREDKCLIYFKKRKTSDLEQLINFLKEKNQKYILFDYGLYDNSQLKKASKECNFGIIMSRPETQGFGIQEIMSCNLPILVWDQTINYYEHLELSGTTVTIWNEKCGKIVYELDELIKIFDSFKNNLNLYNPAQLVLEQLTFEKFNENLKLLFDIKI